MKKLLFLLLLIPVFSFSQSVDGGLKTLTASGTDTYTISEPLPAAYDPKERFIVVFTNACVSCSSATLNRNFLGAKAIKWAGSVSLSAGAIQAGEKKVIAYNGTYYQIVENAPFTSTSAGTVPASGGGTTNFIRADGTWAAPPSSGGTVTSVTSANNVYATVANTTTTPVITIVGAPQISDAAASTAILSASGSQLNFSVATFGAAWSLTRNGLVGVDPSTNVLLNGANNGAGNGAGAYVVGGNSTGSNGNGGNIVLNPGNKNGSGKDGNITLFTTGGSFGGGGHVVFIGDATANPTSNPTAGFILYSDAGNSSHPTVRTPAGLVVDLIAGATAWTDFTLINGWTNDVSCSYNAGYRILSNGRVQFRGVIVAPISSGQAVTGNIAAITPLYSGGIGFNLPITSHITSAGTATVVPINIDLNGAITIPGYTATYTFCLEGVEYMHTNP